jgi:hypothetical protein
MVEKRRRITSIIIVSVVALLTISLYYFIYPLYQQYFPKCIFHNLTGLYCPLCGTQRAVSSLLHGNILLALKDNLLVIAAVFFGIFLFATFFFKPLNRKNIYYRIIYSALFLKAVLYIFVAFTILRNIPAYPFTLLAPL